MTAPDSQAVTEVEWDVRTGHGDDPDFRRLLDLLFGADPAEDGQPQTDPNGGR